jgi:hypothetical protein
MIMACDGIFAGTTPTYDGESFAAFEAWVRETLHKPVYAVGPLLPPGYGEKQSSPAITTKDVKIESFLDTMRSKYGDRSVLFVGEASQRCGCLIHAAIPRFHLGQYFGPRWWDK